QVHVQPDGVAGRFLRDADRPYQARLPEFFLPSRPLAVHRYSAGPGSLRPARNSARTGWLQSGTRFPNHVDKDRVIVNLTCQEQRPRIRNLFIHHLPTPPADLQREVLDGLTRQVKQLPPKLFYDERGSQLFDAITELPEYYVTRTEAQIFHQHERSIRACIPRDAVLIEPGSGNCQKARALLQEAQVATYVPLEISASHLITATHALAKEFPRIAIHAVCGDFTQTQQLPPAVPDRPRVAFFPGSTIGNFEPPAALRLLRRMRNWLGQGGGLLIGVDTRKDPSVLHAAYNDAQGITAAFNLNMLHHLNRTLGTHFKPEVFEPEAMIHQRTGRRQQPQPSQQ